MADRTKMIGSLISYFEKIQGVSEIKLKEIETRLSGMSDQELMQVTKQFEGMKKGGRVELEEGGSTGSSIQDIPLFELAKYLEELKKKQEEARKKASKKAGGGMVDKSLY